MLLLAGALDHDGNQLLATNALLDQTADCGLARRVEMADRIQADDALRAQRPIEQVVEALRCRGRLRRLGPAEVPLHQFISFQHAVALADRERSGKESELQRTLGRLSTGPEMHLF